MSSTPPSPTTNTSTLSDIFSSSPSPSPPPSPNTLTQTHNPHHTPTHKNPPLEPSDIPRLRSTHTTAGYRHGISTSKTHFLQPGFDEGYSLGAVFGLRIGRMIGLLEGLYAYYERMEEIGGKEGGERDGGGENRGVGEKEKERERRGRLLRQAREDLAVERVFGEKWWGEGGWRYEVEGRAGGGETTWMEVVGQHPVVGDEVTWKEVVDQHPVVREWERRVGEEVERRGVRRGVFEGEGWEGGRVGA